MRRFVLIVNAERSAATDVEHTTISRILLYNMPVQVEVQRAADGDRRRNGHVGSQIIIARGRQTRSRIPSAKGDIVVNDPPLRIQRANIRDIPSFAG